VPNAEILVVTTPQQAAAEVAERAGSIAVQTHQKIVGVVENMSGMPCPHCGEVVDVFGTGGGDRVAEGLTRTTGTTVPVLGRIPIDVRLREGGDDGRPVTLTDPESPAGAALRGIAGKLTNRSRGLAGMSLGITPRNKF
jgi:ATP-binding protein involved in chromosome partitioning